MKIVDCNQIWVGFFTYLDGYEDIDQYIEVDFTMNLIFNGDSFHGITEDSESKHIFDKPTTVKGFIDGNKIIFVLNYPYAYFKDNDGEIFVDKNSKHPEIRYFGIFDEIEKCYYGEWEMTVYEEKFGDDYLEEVLNGNFQMRRKK